MKIAIMSDIHSNVYALEAILKQIDSEGVDKIINLGDTLWGMIDPLGTAEILMARSDIIHIMGNGDELLLKDDLNASSYKFARPLLNEKILVWLSNSKEYYELENMLFIHGSPWSKYEYLLSLVMEDGLKDKSLYQIDNELKNIKAKYIFCGHDHKCRTIITPRGKVIINPGSVGLPAYSDNLPFPHKVESNTNYSKYTVIEKDKDEIVKISHNEVIYDCTMASQIAEKNGSLDYAIPIMTGRIDIEK